MFKHYLSIGIIIFLLLSLGACNKASYQSYNNWEEKSLYSGPNVKVRLFSKEKFSKLKLKLVNPDTQIWDAKGKLVSWPAKQRTVYIAKKGLNIILTKKIAGKKFKKVATCKKVFFRSEGKHSINDFEIMLPRIKNYKKYAGCELAINIKHQQINIINKLPLELYLARVLAIEMEPTHFTLEAMKAQAVVARTWALKNMRRHKKHGYNFCDSSHCQVYPGEDFVSKRCEQAIKMTIGQVITYKGHLAEAFYHSTCGGNTVFIEDVWDTPSLNYLIRTEDVWKPGNLTYCAASPFANWQIELSLYEVEKILKQYKIIKANSKLKDIKLDFMNKSGQNKRLLLVLDKQKIKIAAMKFRNIINKKMVKNKILSNFFQIEVIAGKILIKGRGLGHGVGMCQWGARGMAQHGFQYREIIEHYFKGTSIGIQYGSLRKKKY